MNGGSQCSNWHIWQSRTEPCNESNPLKAGLFARETNPRWPQQWERIFSATANSPNFIKQKLTESTLETQNFRRAIFSPYFSNTTHQQPLNFLPFMASMATFSHFSRAMESSPIPGIAPRDMKLLTRVKLPNGGPVMWVFDLPEAEIAPYPEDGIGGWGHWGMLGGSDKIIWRQRGPPQRYAKVGLAFSIPHILEPQLDTRSQTAQWCRSLESRGPTTHY